MKTTGSILGFMVFLTILGSSCNLNLETDEFSLKKSGVGGCDTCKVVKSVENQRGFISYDAETDLFAIRVPEEGTYDSQDVGIVTNMPDELKEQVMNFDYTKGIMEVVFSGEFMEFNDRSFIGPVGTTFYYLQLSYLEIINKTEK